MRDDLGKSQVESPSADEANWVNIAEAQTMVKGRSITADLGTESWTAKIE
jgi:hypothetical protein